MRFRVINAERQSSVETVKEDFRLVFSMSSRTPLPQQRRYPICALPTTTFSTKRTRRRILDENDVKDRKELPLSFTGTVRQSLMEYNTPPRRAFHAVEEIAKK